MNVNNQCILLVEDNPDDVLLTTRALKKCSIDNPIVVACNGVEAMDFLFCHGKNASSSSTEKPAIILLDINLPLVDGLEVLKELRTRDNDCRIPVVILSSSVNEHDLERGKSLGADGYLRKPVNYHEFVELVYQIKAIWLSKKSQPMSNQSI